MADTIIEKHKETRLTRFRVQNYRGLRDVTFDGLQPLNVIIGPNGCGKTTVLSAISFLADFFRGTIETALEKHEVSFTDLLNQNSSGEIKYEVEVENFSSLNLNKIYLHYELGLVSNGLLKVSSEFLAGKNRITDDTTRFLQRFSDKPIRMGDTELSDEAQKIFMHMYNRSMTSFDESKTGFFHSPIIDRVSIHSFIPFEIPGHCLISDDPELKANASNLVDVLYDMSHKFPQVVNEINEVIRVAVPGIESIAAKKIGGEAVLFVMAKGLEKPILRQFVSDGTLKLLALLVLLRNPNPPPLLLIEEPENFLNPQMMRSLADEFIEASTRTQIIMTTHNPYLISGFTPKELWVMGSSSNEGITATRADRIADCQFYFDNHRPLGDQWMQRIISDFGI